MSKESVEHKSVLLDETVSFLAVKEGGIYLDATLGVGGHSREIIRRGGKVLALERDPMILRLTQEKFLGNPNFLGVQGNFRYLRELIVPLGYSAFDGIVFDLGLNSIQLRQSGRGFGFSTSEPLDMRLDPFLGKTAAEIINESTQGELYEIFTKFGEERLSSRLVDFIKKRRSLGRIETTTDLYGIIESLNLGKEQERRVAARVFQALRIAVNDELLNLEEALPQALGMLKENGRLVVISFHSLEDRLVKFFFLRGEKTGQARVLTRRPVTPSGEEVSENTSSRSAKLRVLIKIYGSEK